MGSSEQDIGWAGVRLRRLSGGTSVGTILKGPLLKRAEHEAVLSAQSLLEAAEREAAERLSEAEHQAALSVEERLRTRVQDLDQRESDMESAVWTRLVANNQALNHAWTAALDELERRVSTVVQDALSRLAVELPPEDRVRACVRQLLAQSGRPDAGELHVAETDLAAVALMTGLPWPVRANRELLPGTVRLVAPHGRWDIDVAGALAGLLSALSGNQFGADVDAGAFRDASAEWQALDEDKAQLSNSHHGD